ncbi:hypothetical protein [Mycobacterium sp. OTB74]|uniref:hypothetical protein n=1 Tax=Mycobacterium sp. OTB74 TaxID=1853452 RepID=UPI002476A70B|nr:hypothetical protein [Mycobacterium sp. OTB74]MDH6247594.1 hypothetical protein [Mycobacterium sp. OTB74]
MGTHRLLHRFAIAAGGTAVIAMIGLTAGCGGGGKAPETPTTTTTTTTTTTVTTTTVPEVTPSEKSIDPSGGNLFTPTVIAPAAPTGIPGRHNNHN